jgi:hypothetical protein
MSINVTISRVAGAPATVAYDWDYDYGPGYPRDHYPPKPIDASARFDRYDDVTSVPDAVGTIHLQGHFELYRTLVIDNLTYQLDDTQGTSAGWVDMIQSEDTGIQRY